MQQHIKIIPADPGYYALDRYFLVGGVEIEKLPVVAWCIRINDNADFHQHYVEPICLHALTSEYSNEVLHPDGRVIRYGVQVWDSFDDFQDDVKSKFEYTNPKYSQFVEFLEGRNDNGKRNRR